MGIGTTQTKGCTQTDFTHTDPTGSPLGEKSFVPRPGSSRATRFPTRFSPFGAVNNSMGAPNNNDLNSLNADIIDVLDSSEDLPAEDLPIYWVPSNNLLINEFQPSSSPSPLISETSLQNQHRELRQNTEPYLDINYGVLEDHREHSLPLGCHSRNENNLSSVPSHSQTRSKTTKPKRSTQKDKENNKTQRDRQAQKLGYSDNAALQRAQRAQRAYELGLQAFAAIQKEQGGDANATEDEIRALGSKIYAAMMKAQKDVRAQRRNFPNYAALQRVQADERAQQAGFANHTALQHFRKEEEIRALGLQAFAARQKEQGNDAKATEEEIQAEIQKLGRQACAAKLTAQRDKKAQDEGFSDHKARRRAQYVIEKKQKQNATPQNVVSEMWNA